MNDISKKHDWVSILLALCSVRRVAMYTPHDDIHVRIPFYIVVVVKKFRANALMKRSLCKHCTKQVAKFHKQSHFVPF